jgi:hypothetical protein
MRTFIPFLIILALSSVIPANAQETFADSSQAVVDTLPGEFGLFKNEDILHLALRFDLKEYIRKKPKDEYLDAILTYYINERDSINRDIRLRSRGVFRNGYCSFPPIYLNFKKSDFRKDDIKKIGKMKLVTHCQTGNEDLLFKEYLIYKLYNVLTDYSFRVRLVQIDYISTSSNHKTINSYGFFIEPLGILAERLNAVPVNSPAISQKNVIPEMMDRVAIFNYMIGNTDWSVPGQHNCKILSGSFFHQPGLGVIVPYDFDYSGLVNAHYAVPAQGLSINHVTQRWYLGECRSEETFREELKEFSDKKDDIYKLISEFPYLKEKVKTGMIKYLDEFFNSVDKGGIMYSLRNQCKNP